MKVVIAPDKFKGSLSGYQLIYAIKSTLASKYNGRVDINSIQLADGGDGLMDVFLSSGDYQKRKLRACDPLNREVDTHYLYAEGSQTAIIEMSAISGLRLLGPIERDAMRASSYGTGELVMDALSLGAKNIILGLGGSATTDLGLGMAAALGYGFFDMNQQLISATAEHMIQVSRIVPPKHMPWKNVGIQVACDVDNTLYGPMGAAYVYAPQKGATTQEVQCLDKGLASMCSVMESHFGIPLSTLKGGGAAGGMGVGAVSFLGGKLRPGVDIVFDFVGFEEAVCDADWIITAEGKVDEQSFMGKVLDGVLKRKPIQTKVAVLCGICDLSPEECQARGVDQVISLMDYAASLEDAIQNAEALVRRATLDLLLD